MIVFESKFYDLSQMPTAIWVPSNCGWLSKVTEADLPDCYRGTPLEILQQIGAEYEPSLGAEEIVATLIEEMKLEIDEGVPLDQKASILLVFLLSQGLAREMGQA